MAVLDYGSGEISRIGELLMTLVVCWYKERNQAINMAADSRLGPTYGKTVTVNAPKVLPIPILARRIDMMQPDKDFSPSQQVGTFPYDVGAYGYGYAGSSTAALCTHSSVVACLTNLTSDEVQALPSISSVAKLYCHFADRIVAHKGLRFEAIITGFCRRLKQRRTYHITSHQDNLVHSPKLINLQNEEYFAIGSGKGAVDEHLTQARNINPDCGMMHAIILAIKGERNDLDGYPHFGGCSEVEDFANYQLLNRLPGKFRVETEIFGGSINDVDLEGFQVGGYSVSGDIRPVIGNGL